MAENSEPKDALRRIRARKMPAFVEALKALQDEAGSLAKLLNADPGMPLGFDWPGIRRAMDNVETLMLDYQNKSLEEAGVVPLDVFSPKRTSDEAGQ